LAATAQTLIRAGVAGMVMGATHGVLCGQATANLTASKVDRFVVTNSVHIDDAKQIKQLKIISVAPLMAEAIKRIHTGESVGALFG
jgi:ribose-phosphate pyrophosphokinase